MGCYWETSWNKTSIENKPGNILNRGVKEKRAQYIQRNNELMQEFCFAHSSNKSNINTIFNSHFPGSVLWDLFGREAAMIYNTCNTSIRKMCLLDQRSHRYFLEPISKLKHIKVDFMKIFIQFTEQLACSTSSRELPETYFISSPMTVEAVLVTIYLK